MPRRSELGTTTAASSTLEHQQQQQHHVRVVTAATADDQNQRQPLPSSPSKHSTHSRSSNNNNRKSLRISRHSLQPQHPIQHPSLRQSRVADSGIEFHSAPSATTASTVVNIMAAIIGAGILSIGQSTLFMSIGFTLIVLTFFWLISLFSCYTISVCCEYMTIFSEAQMLTACLCGGPKTTEEAAVVDAYNRNERKKKKKEKKRQSNSSGLGIDEQTSSSDDDSVIVPQHYPISSAESMPERPGSQRTSVKTATTTKSLERRKKKKQQQKQLRESQLANDREEDEHEDENENDPLINDSRNNNDDEGEEWSDAEGNNSSKSDDEDDDDIEELPQEYVEAIVAVNKSRNLVNLSVDMLFGLTYFLYVVAYTRSLSDAMVSVSIDLNFPSFFTHRIGWLVIASACYIALAMRRVFAEVALTSLFGIASIFFVVLCVVVRYFDRYKIESEPISNYPPAEDNSWFYIGPKFLSAFCVVSSAFGYQVIHPPFYLELKQRSPANMQKAVVIAVTVVYLSYCLSGLVSIALFGSNVNEPSAGGNVVNLFNNHDLLVNVARFLLMVHFITVIPITICTVRQCGHRIYLRLTNQHERAEDQDEVFKVPFASVVIEGLIAILAGVTVSAVVPGMSFVIALCGSLGGSGSLLILPGICGMYVYSEMDQRGFKGDEYRNDGENHTTSTGLPVTALPPHHQNITSSSIPASSSSTASLSSPAVKQPITGAGIPISSSPPPPPTQQQTTRETMPIFDEHGNIDPQHVQEKSENSSKRHLVERNISILGNEDEENSKNKKKKKGNNTNNNQQQQHQEEGIPE